ncbi:MAG: GLPGLI family protein [Bacteroidales bacterium]|jgi:GLPGLI family protein|nr:GLPGLI family protein [Bacteroidales bacterium]
MKTSKLLVMTTFMMMAGMVSAQQFSGKATYIEDYTKMAKKEIAAAEAQLSQLSPEQRMSIMQALENDAKMEMELRFNNEAALYAAPDRIDLNTSQENTGINVVVSVEGTMAHYCNVKTGKVVTQEVLANREFLVEDKIKTCEWQLHPETKTIGRFQANKATTAKDSAVITAWYTTDIPVNTGPRGFNGLPGLILEVSAGDSQILFQDVVLNNSYATISPPRQGKKMSREKFEKMAEKHKRESVTIIEND